eukprot:Skav228865  [mRNA]  locus=scaffold816:232247:236842:- [translate_table: standard]
MGLVLKSLTSNHRELVEATVAVAGHEALPGKLITARLLNELTDHDIVVQRQGQDGTTVYALVAKEPLLRRLAQGEMPGRDPCVVSNEGTKRR